MASQRPASAPASDGNAFWRTPLIGGLVIVAAGLAAFANGLATPFVFDDEPSILANPSLDGFWSAWSPPVNGGITVAGRPLLNVSFALNRALSGVNPWSYHALNLAIHLGAALALFGIVRRTLQRVGPPLVGVPLVAGAGASTSDGPTTLAFFAALLWAVHPLQTESVTYVVQRAESMAGLFFLLTLWCFIRASDAGATRRWAIGAVLACAAGMATKETMVTAPVIVLLYDRTFVGRTFAVAWRERGRLHAMLFATWLLLAWLVLKAGDRGGTFALSDAGAWWRYDLTQLIAVVSYLRLAFWPHPLAIDHGAFWVTQPLTVLPHAILVGALVAATIAALVRWPRWGFLGAWFFLGLAPSSLLPGTLQMIVEHRMYLPLAAVAVLVVLAGYSILGRRSLALLAAAALASGIVLAARNQDYATPIRLFEDTVAKHPGNARAMALLGDYYRRAGRLADAQRMLERSLQAAPDVPEVLSNLGDVRQALGDASGAVASFERAVALRPKNAAYLNNLGSALLATGRTREGVERFEAALRASPDQRRTRENLANALAQSGRMPEAADQFETLLKSGARGAELRTNYAEVLRAMNRAEEALIQLSLAVRDEPNNADAHVRLGSALGRMGRLREALEEFQSALRLDPANETARRNTALAQQRLQAGR